jgi:hypothetical protein
MKHLISTVVLLAVCGCDRNAPGAQDGSGAVTPPVNLNAEKTSHTNSQTYLNKTMRGKVSRHGLYRLVRSGGVINDPNTGTGKAVIKPVVELVRTTERIPLIKGAQMYLQYRIWPLPAQPAYVDLRRVLRHPEMTLPDGSVSTGSDYMIKGKVSSNQVIAYTGYGLDENYELVEGEWIFEIWYKDRKMIEQKFTTYQPDQAEIATLKPLLELGTKVVGQEETSGKPFSRFNWPRLTVGKSRQAPEPVDSAQEN